MKANRFNGMSGHSLIPPSIQDALLRNMSAAGLRALRPLPENAQKVIDNAVVRVGRQRLQLVSDLIDLGLTYNLDDAMSVTELQWDAVGETGYAKRMMNPSARGENQLPDANPFRIPVYITSDDFQLGIRSLRMSQRVGMPLDTSLIEQATRNVNEAIEDQGINGASVQVNGGNDAPGILTAPNANNVAYSSNESWTAAGHDGEDILGDVSNLISAAQGDKRFGPYYLYVNSAYGLKLSTTDFKSQSSDTILTRLQQIQVGGANLRVRISDMMPTDRVALVQMTSDVIDLVDGQRPVAVPWTSADGFQFHWLVMAIQIVRVKTDANDASGIVLGNLTLP